MKCNCAERREMIKAAADAAVKRDVAGVKDQVKAVGRSIRKDLTAALRRLSVRK